MDMSTISAALSSIQAVVEITKNVNNISKDAAVKEKAIELQNLIISLQANLLQIQMDFGKTSTEKEQLEKQLAQYKDWEEIKKQYKLTEIHKGNFAYASQNKDEPQHYLCANCFNNNKKSILQALDAAYYSCQSCSAKIVYQEPIYIS